MTDRRLIEESFPLKEVSTDSKHEKNVRHGHISTLHIWPARRPLAASRAAIIAALMPDPGDEAGRAELNKKIASITHWGTENGPALDYFRREIRKAYGGRAPRVLDMFAGGGAIPLEAMRLGCDVTAIDYNPVAWFILKCTLEFPQRLAGKTWPLPSDELRVTSDELREEHNEWVSEEEGEDDGTDDGAYALDGVTTRAVREAAEEPYQPSLLRETGAEYTVEGNLADHVRYWGRWVLARAREGLAPYYPTVDGQPTVAYLWARTVPCPDPACGATVPLLKTLWLSKKAEKTLPDTPANRARPDFLRIKTTRNTSRVVINGRRALRLTPPTKGQGGLVRFDIWTPGESEVVPEGTMTGSSSVCPACGIHLAADYIKDCGRREELGAQMTAVITVTEYGKDFRLPVNDDLVAEQAARGMLDEVGANLPFGWPDEPLPSNDRHRSVGSQLPQYGFKHWVDIHTPRQRVAIATLIQWTRLAQVHASAFYSDQLWKDAITAYLTSVVNKAIQYSSSLTTWTNSREQLRDTYAEFNLSMTWDFVEVVPTNPGGGGFLAHLAWVARYLDRVRNTFDYDINAPQVLQQSATDALPKGIDAIITDPPYYDSFAYADLSDLFYVWMRRTLVEPFPCFQTDELTAKTEELVQQVRSGEEGRKGKARYESGMAKAFGQANQSLIEKGYLVVVFAHKEPDAWETLSGAIIKAGFTVTASWPIDTEKEGRARASSGSANLASSVWLVCRKRPPNAGTGRYRAVRRAMEERVTERLRYFWDMGLSGPDFVWAAVGPALESYSAYDEVRRLDGSLFTVGEFLKESRRLVADFTLGRILHGQSTEGLDEWTRYYLIHRANFGLDDAPVGECILLSQGYGLDLNDLRTDRGYIRAAPGSAVRLAKWDERTRPDLGEPHPGGGLPLIDVAHRLMRLWAAGDTAALNAYMAARGLRDNDLFWAVAQAVLEMARPGGRERSLLEAVVAWGRGRVAATPAEQTSWLEDK